MHLLVLLGGLLAAFAFTAHGSICTTYCSLTTNIALSNAGAVQRYFGGKIRSIDCAKAANALTPGVFNSFLPTSAIDPNAAATELFVRVCDADQQNFVGVYCLASCQELQALPPLPSVVLKEEEEEEREVETPRFKTNVRHLTDCTDDCFESTVSLLEEAQAIMLRGQLVVSVNCAGAGSVLKASLFQKMLPYLGSGLGSGNDTGNGTTNGTTNGTSVSARDVLVAVCGANPVAFVSAYCQLQCNKPTALPSILLPPNLGLPPTSAVAARRLLAMTGDAAPSLLNCTCPYTLVGSPVYTDSQNCFCSIDFSGGNTTYYFFAPDLLIAPPIATVAPVGPPPDELAVVVGDLVVMPLVNCSCASIAPYTPVAGGSTTASNCSCVAYFPAESNEEPVSALIPSVVVYPGTLVQAVAPPKAALRALEDVVGYV